MKDSTLLTPLAHAQNSKFKFKQYQIYDEDKQIFNTQWCRRGDILQPQHRHLTQAVVSLIDLRKMEKS